MALSFRDIDTKLRQYPGATTVAVSRANYIVLLGLTEPNASTPSHKKHIEYSLRPGAAIGSIIRVVAADHIQGDDTYVLS